MLHHQLGLFMRWIVFTNRIDKENSNPNFQNTLLHRPSPNKVVGARPTVISSNALIHASTRNSRMFKAILEACPREFG
ncbi:hypothetical protein ZWY2020_020742 [Hordeum vulgare]|nr:hypothetical protein ZWY2020_020742 [Hordeum vulgare]